MFFKRAKQGKSKSAEPESAAPAPAPSSETHAGANGSAPSLPNLDAGGLDPKTLGFETTADIEPASGAVGQARALNALTFGAGMKGPGYNILVTGTEGSGYAATVRSELQAIARTTEKPSDWVYVSSFDAAGGFRALKLPAGTAKAFADGMAQVIDRLADALPAAFAADDYELKRRTIEEEFRFSREDALETLRREAEAQNIALLRTPAGIAVAPILEGKVVKTDVFNSVPEELRREVETKIAALESEIEALLAERPGAEKARRERLNALNEQVAGRQVRAVLDELKIQFGDASGVESFIKAAGRDLIRNAALFLGSGGHESVKVPVGTIGDPRFMRYRVHVMAASGATPGAPVVAEANPTYANIFGRVESAAGGGEGQPVQVSRIKPGALHRANGGFLLLEARELLSAPRATAEALARALEAGEIRFDPPSEPVALGSSEIPDLEPIPLSAKLVVLGDAADQRALAKGCPRLMRLFKVEAEFEDSVERSDEIITAYARLIAGIVAQNSLKPVDAGGVAMLIDEAARKAGGNGKLSLEVSHIADICREADHWAGREGRKVTSIDDVKRALEERKGRSGARGLGALS
ncbi:MAG TPA: ATP-binding protein [Hyphomicrobium sp.]|nr:ATP-binding protein [Hyphomicrobium sp.]